MLVLVIALALVLSLAARVVSDGHQRRSSHQPSYRQELHHSVRLHGLT